MKAILRSINNFSCKLKQSNNLKYNISPKIRSNKFKNISGNGNVTIEDAITRNLKDYKIYGNTYQNSTSGKNLYTVHNMKTITSPAIINGEIIEISYDNTSGTTKYLEFHTNISSLITENEKYSIICEILEINGTGALRLNSLNNNLNQSQFSVPSSYNISNLTSGQILIDIVTALSNFENALCCIRSNIRLRAGQSCSVKLRMSLIKGTVSENNFSYEPYTGGQPSPNPDYPQEIISCGDRTKNLFDGEYETGGYDISTGEKVINTSQYRNINFIEVKPNTTYVFSINGTTIIETPRYFYYDKNKNKITSEVTNGIFTTPNNCYYLNWHSSGLKTNYPDGLTKPMIEKGSINTPYEPYGYKIPVNVRSENLFDGEYEIGGYDISTGEKAVNAYQYRNKNFIEVKPNTVYTFSLNEIKITETPRYYYYDKNKNFLSSEVVNGNFTTPNNCYFVNWNSSALKTNYPDGLIKPMITEGSTVPTKFQPYYNETTNIYLDEPLRKIDGYSDYIDFKNGKVVRQLGEVILDGSENWNGIQDYQSSSTMASKNGTISVMKRMNKTNNLISNKFNVQKNDNISDNITAQSNLKNAHFCIRKNNPDRIYFKWENWQGKTGNEVKEIVTLEPITINYTLATPTKEDIELPNINLIEGKNIITIGTDVQGVFETEYYSKEIIDISNYKYNLRKVED